MDLERGDIAIKKRCYMFTGFATFVSGGWVVAKCPRTAGNVFYGPYGTTVDEFMLQRLPELSLNSLREWSHRSSNLVQDESFRRSLKTITF